MEAWETDPDAWKNEGKETVPVWQRLNEDLKIADSWLEYLVKNPIQNFKIRHPDYLNPVMWESESPVRLDNSLGAYSYFVGIRNVLIKAKKMGYISEDELPEDSPDYLEGFTR